MSAQGKTRTLPEPLHGASGELGLRWAQAPPAHAAPAQPPGPQAVAASSRSEIARLEHLVLLFAGRRLPPRWLRVAGSPGVVPLPSPGAAVGAVT